MIIGHNADIAWGFTNLGPDVTDLYLEKVEGRDVAPGRRARSRSTIAHRDDRGPRRRRRRAHGPRDRPRAAAHRRLAGAQPVGANAPTDEPDATGRGNGYGVALQWTALEPGTTADAILALNRASDWDEFRAAAADFAVPAQNLVYADREGHIGYQAPGLVPIRKSGNDGRDAGRGLGVGQRLDRRVRPVRRAAERARPGGGLRRHRQPGRHRAPTTPTSSPTTGTTATARPGSASCSRREGELSVDEMTRLQLDTTNPMAATLVPYLLDIEDLLGGYYRDGQELLADWDFAQPADSAAAAYYNVVWSNLLRLTFHDELREDIWPDGGDRWFARGRPACSRDPAGPGGTTSTTEDVVESRDDILRQAHGRRPRRADPAPGAATRATGRGATCTGSTCTARRWASPASRRSSGSSTATATRSAAARASSTRPRWDAAEGYEVTSAPSMRMVVVLADLDGSRWINLTGVSGHPASSHYADQTELWVAGDYLPWAVLARRRRGGRRATRADPRPGLPTDADGARHAVRLASRACTPARRDRVRDRAVVRLGGHVDARPRRRGAARRSERARRDPGQGPVVAAAAAAQPVAAPARPPGRAPAPRRRRDRVRRRAAARSARAARAGGQRRRSRS